MLTFGEVELRLRDGVHVGTVGIELVISAVILEVMAPGSTYSICSLIYHSLDKVRCVQAKVPGMTRTAMAKTC